MNTALEVFINEYGRLLIHLFSYLQLIKKDEYKIYFRRSVQWQ